MWAGGLNMLLGGMIIVGSQEDAWSQGGIVDLNENAAEARMKRIGKARKIIMNFAISGGILVSIGFLAWKLIGGIIE